MLPSRNHEADTVVICLAATLSKKKPSGHYKINSTSRSIYGGKPLKTLKKLLSKPHLSMIRQDRIQRHIMRLRRKITHIAVSKP